MVEKIKVIPEKLPRKKQKPWGKRFTGYPKGKGFGRKGGGKVETALVAKQYARRKS